jgi:hypothetical protein
MSTGLNPLTVKNDINTGSLYDLVEGIWLCNIWDDNNRELGVWVCLSDLGSLVLRPNSGHNLVSSLDEKLENMACRRQSVERRIVHKH